jgi:YfiH family protein
MAVGSKPAMIVSRLRLLVVLWIPPRDPPSRSGLARHDMTPTSPEALSTPEPVNRVAPPMPWPTGWIAPELTDAQGRALPRLVACMTARAGGVSQAPYASFNLGDHVADDPVAVARNRELAGRFMARLAGQTDAAVGVHAGVDACFEAVAPWPVAWLEQVHGARMHRLRASDVGPHGHMLTPRADGLFTTEPGLVCAVMVADCLPILLADQQGRGVAALHAGWRGLAGAGEAMGGRGIVEAGVAALCEATQAPASDLVAWLGPCIGPRRFQVGADVLAAFGVDPFAVAARGADRPDAPDPCFQPDTDAGEASPRWWADLAGLARLRLRAAGVEAVSGGTWCTVDEPARFFSYRRDRVTGRQAAMIALR